MATNNREDIVSKYTFSIQNLDFEHKNTSIVLKKCSNSDYKGTYPRRAGTQRMESLNKLNNLTIDDIFEIVISNNDEHNGILICDIVSDLAYKLMLSGFGNDAIAMWECNATKNINYFAFRRLINLFMHGSDGIKKSVPKINMIEIEPNPRKAYFWCVAFFLLDKHEEFGLLSDASTQVGWNTIAVLDTLQNTGVLSAEDLVNIEGDAVKFLRTIYPNLSQK